MSNFAFLEAQFPPIHRATSRAEQYVNNDPRTACFHARRALELITAWLYDNDNRFRPVYDTSLSAQLYGDSFITYVSEEVRGKAHIIRRAGNGAVHNNRPVKESTALMVVQELFQITYWLARTYGSPELVRTLPTQFELAKLPPSLDTLKQNTTAVLKTLVEKQQKQDQELARQRAANEALQDQLAQAQRRIEQNRLDNQRVPDQHNYTPNEAQTRALIIDVLLREAGWLIPDPLPKAANPGGVSVEHRVAGMPNKRGFGYVDYVLWGDDGRPLALIEAKRTSKKGDTGKQQAQLYADCLEEMYGRRPVIFFTNGYQTHLWDDQHYPPRLVEGFYTKDELERLLQRREIAQNLQNVPTNKEIVDRYYQEAAIRHTTALFSDRRRKALLVMATGTGKTRTAIALVDILMRGNWVKRVLFLADRTALVTQAIKGFKAHLPHANPVNLVEDKREAESSRVVISTYHTMMNLIDQMQEGERLFSVGHFDLIIIDEAHRSVFHKFKAIFSYFDSLLLGLTATPKDEVDRNTYSLFDLAPGAPTYAYDLELAVADGYLVPPKHIPAPTQFTSDGIKYESLSEEEKVEWDALEWAETGDIPDKVSTADLNKWLFNEDTVDQVLENLMRHGLQVAGGDRLGKTIIFAKNQEHARYIMARFDHHYPQYAGQFTAVITSEVNYAQKLIEKFSEKEKPPHIAVSVDMLDTGIDVPEVVNLVFFKPVRSKTKFFQMIGRGTRLCPDLFGPDEDKQAFVIFDHCQNFEFFEAYPDGVVAKAPPSLAERLFKQRLTLLEKLHHTAVRQPDGEAAELAQAIKESLHQQVANMNTANFIVRPAREYVEKYQRREAWERIGAQELGELEAHVAGLPTTLPEDGESAKRFDNLLLQMQIAFVENTAVFVQMQNQVMEIAAGLESSFAVPLVAAQKQLIFALQDEAYWETINLRQLEEVRLALRHLMDYVPKRTQNPLYTQFSDKMLMGEERPIYLGTSGVRKKQYRQKIRQFIYDHESLPAIRKIRQAEPLTGNDLVALETFFYESDIVGGREAFEAALDKQDNLALFIRRLVGLDKRAARQKFSRYLDDKTLTAEQIEFVNYIIEQLATSGVVEVGNLYEEPFTYLHGQGLDGVFGGELADGLVALVREVNTAVG